MPSLLQSAARSAAVSFVIALVAPAASVAQNFMVSGVDMDANATSEQIESAIDAVEARDGLDASVRDSVIELLRSAQSQAQNRQTAVAATAAYAASIQNAPAQTQALRAALDEPMPPPPTAEDFGIDDSTTLAELEQRLALELADRAAIDSQVTAMQTESGIQAGRPSVARERIEELRRLIDEDDAAAGDVANPDAPKLLQEAQSLNASLVRATRLAEIERLEQETLSHVFRSKLLQAQEGTASRQRATVTRRVDLLRTLVNERRRIVAEDAQQATTASFLAAADKHPIVVSLAEDNADLTQRLIGNAMQIEELEAQLNQAQIDTDDLEQRLARSRQRLDTGGLSRVIGRLLVEERRNLPQLSLYRRQIDARTSQLAEVGLALVDVQEQRRDLSLIDVRTQNLVDDLADEVTDENELATAAADIRLLLRDRRDLLAKTESSYRSYLQVLGDIDITQRRQLELAENYRLFLDQNLIWIPSADIAFTGNWRAELEAAVETLSPNVWTTAATELVASVGKNIAAGFFFLILLLSLLVARKSANRYEKTFNARVGRLSTDHIGLTFASLIIAVVRVAPIPLMVIATHWFLNNAPQLSTYSEPIAESLGWMASFLFNAMLLRELSSSDGVFRVHFDWNKDTLAVLRRQLGLLVYVGAPLVLITGILVRSNSTGDLATLGRWMFVVLMIFFAFIAHSLLNPRAVPVARYLDRSPNSWPSRLRWLWYGLAVGSPLMLSLLAILGYNYAATTLAGSLVETTWLVLGLGVANLVILRWLALAQRKMAFQIALRKREALRAEKEAEALPGTETEAPAPEPEPLDLEKVDKQTRKILGTGLLFVAVMVGWGIWSDMLPAFTLLEQVDLWSQTVTVDGVDTIQPVTLADLLLAVLIAIVTAVAANNLPGLMEVLIPRQLAREPGSRYTITTLVRYVVIIVGLVSVLGIVGWNWSQIQWLVAALSVGLGFGLQEIVANFVSGLVILFERPVRIGDTVTVGQLTGTVTRVRIRATTITDWDRKEIIVPNKSFITEQVVNWTLSDPITRITIPVSVSYGSDVTLTHQVMSETINNLPLVLDDPQPMVYFSGFGDSALEFTLHVYLRQLNDRMPMIHEVHEAVFAALRQNGIEIPFPQRDLHIRTSK